MENSKNHGLLTLEPEIINNIKTATNISWLLARLAEISKKGTMKINDYGESNLILGRILELQSQQVQEVTKVETFEDERINAYLFELKEKVEGYEKMIKSQEEEIKRLEGILGKGKNLEKNQDDNLLRLENQLK